MSTLSLHKQMDDYALWKQTMIKQIMRYRTWLTRNQLASPELLKQLEHSVKVLELEHITLAFIGEFSRGKTELINSLFFADFGQRLLPSQAGRTTMCPTEIFFDPKQATSSIKLLPIATRNRDSSLAELKQQPEDWLQIELDYSNPDSLIAAFAHISQHAAVSIEQAVALGFLPEALEATEQLNQVLIPAWRHALINIDHPLLRQGLRIIDTPGFNALGSEPELTLSLLPSTQAIVFLLSADSGVTASDMAIWQQSLLAQQQPREQRLHFAVLNKIDTLWDSLQQDAFAKSSIQSIQQHTAQLLGLPLDQVLAVSARSALQAKINNDAELLAHSRIDELEQFLGKQVMAQKEQLMERTIVQQLSAMLSNSQQLTKQRLQVAQQEKKLLDEHPQGDTAVLEDLLGQAKAEHQLTQQRLLNLKTNQRLLHRQGETLCAQINSQDLKKAILKAQRNLITSWTSLGINRAITEFSRELQDSLRDFTTEAHRANKMLRAIYARHNSENPVFGVEAPTLRIHSCLRELQFLCDKMDEFRRDFKTLLTEQQQIGRRFYETFVQQALHLHERVRQETLMWSNSALNPLLQQGIEQKQRVENHILRLQTLTFTAHNKQQRTTLLHQLINDLDTQQMQVTEILRNIRRPAPQRRQAEVVQLATPLTGNS